MVPTGPNRLNKEVCQEGLLCPSLLIILHRCTKFRSCSSYCVSLGLSKCIRCHFETLMYETNKICHIWHINQDSHHVCQVCQSLQNLPLSYSSLILSDRNLVCCHDNVLSQNPQKLCISAIPFTEDHVDLMKSLQGVC